MAWEYSTVTPATTPAVSLAVAKNHLRVYFDDDDDMITRLVGVAEMHTSHILGIDLVPATYKAVTDEMPNPEGEYMPRFPIKTDVVTPTLVSEDEDGVETTYTCEKVFGKNALKTPDNLVSGEELYTYTYSAGLATVPEPIVQSILFLTFQMYDGQRGLIAEDITAAHCLLEDYRYGGIAV